MQIPHTKGSLMKNVLLIVTGASPQVLTETLFGIVMPMLSNALFRQGHLVPLLLDYHCAVIKFLHILQLNSLNREAFAGEL
jgi:hypothetical protein